MQENKSKYDKFNVAIGILAVSFIFLSFCYDFIIVPYVLVNKAEKGQFQTTCAYVIDKEKAKYRYNYIIRIDDKDYSDLDIIKNSALWTPHLQKLHNFPIHQKDKNFRKVEFNQCKVVQYVEIYNFLGFRDFYLYDYKN